MARNPEGMSMDRQNNDRTTSEASFEYSDPRITPESSKPESLSGAELSEQQMQIIAAAVPGGVENLQDVYPLSPLQEGLLFHHVLSGNNDGYILATLLQLRSPEQIEQLVEALGKIIERHDALRTAVLWEHLPSPVQAVFRHVQLPVEQVIFDDGRDPLNELRGRLQTPTDKFDVRRAPMMRLIVAGSGLSSPCYALLQLHHLICDHQSLGIILDEMMTCLEGRVAELPTSLRYRDFVEEALASVGNNSPAAFLRRKLGDLGESTAAFGLADVHDDGGGCQEVRVEIGSELADRVRARARSLKVGVARLFHAAWGLVVAHTSGREDIVFGTVVLARKKSRSSQVREVGLCVNTLPLRMQLAQITAEQLIHRTDEQLTKLMKYQHVPLHVSQRFSGVAGTDPLFNTLFTFRRSVPARHSSERSAAAIRILDRGEARTNYPITVLVDDLGGDFRLTVQTNRRLDAQRVAGYLHSAAESLVEALESAPQTPALALSILPESERGKLLDAFNATHAGYPTKLLVHELFEEQVARTPDAVAVVYEEQSLTYARLNEKANRLANYLKRQGVGPDQLVGICVERSLDVVVGLMGILKAGGAYVPLDPGYPHRPPRICAH